jgi:hypothetical protein
MKHAPLALAAVVVAVELVGSAKLRFADFDIAPPSVAGLVTVKSEGLLEFRVVAAPA